MTSTSPLMTPIHPPKNGSQMNHCWLFHWILFRSEYLFGVQCSSHVSVSHSLFLLISLSALFSFCRITSPSPTSSFPPLVVFSQILNEVFIVWLSVSQVRGDKSEEGKFHHLLTRLSVERSMMTWAAVVVSDHVDDQQTHSDWIYCSSLSSFRSVLLLLLMSLIILDDDTIVFSVSLFPTNDG